MSASAETTTPASSSVSPTAVVTSSASSATPIGTVTTPSPSSTPGGGPNNPTSSLYLFTFLATLLLLLGVSCAILVRSFILRRRIRRRLDEAIAAGVFLPGARGPGGRPRREIGERPKFWEVWIAGESRTGDNGGWTAIQPVAATVLPEKTSEQPSAPAPAPVPPEPSRASTFFSRFIRARPRVIPPPSSRPTNPISAAPRSQPAQLQSSSTTVLQQQTSPAAINDPQKVQVSVLIAMPTRRRLKPPPRNLIASHGPQLTSSSVSLADSVKGKGRTVDYDDEGDEDEDAEEELPEVLFGVVEADVSQPLATEKTSGALLAPPGRDDVYHLDVSERGSENPLIN